MPSSRGVGAAAAVVLLAVLQQVSSNKVAFPDGPRTAGAAAPQASQAVLAESRLLADAAGGFGLSGAAGAAGQTRNLGAGAGPGAGPGLGLGAILAQGRRRPDCPLCDPSVYSYCGDRLLHDACCCLRDNQPLPPECELAECSFLHAKSCYEHGLITRCCCDRRLF